MINEAYIAGFTDADGHISLIKRKKTGRENISYNVCFMLTNTDLKVLQEIQDFLGFGRLEQKCNKHKKSNWKPVHRLYITSLLETKIVLDKIIPFLSIKKDIALLVRDYCKYRMNANFGFQLRGVGTSAPTTEQDKEFYENSRKLRENGWREV